MSIAGTRSYESSAAGAAAQLRDQAAGLTNPGVWDEIVVNTWAREIEAVKIPAVKTEVTAFRTVPVIPMVDLLPREIAPPSMIPQQARPMVPSMAINTAAYNRLGGAFSAVPMSIFGIGTAIGTLAIEFGPGIAKHIIGRLAVDVASAGFDATFKKLGKRLDDRLRMRIETGLGAGSGKRVNVRNGHGHGDQVHEDPCNWYDFWCWLA